MPNEGEANDPGQRDQGTRGWQNQGCQGRSQCRQGNRSADLQRGRQPRFEGREPRLQGHILDWTGERTPERYIQTTREISIYVRAVYTKYTVDFTAAVDTLDLADLDEPLAPDPGNLVAFEQWKYVRTPPTYKCPHSRPCYFLSTNWPTVWVLSHCRATSHTVQFPLFFFQTTKRT